jgi:hypothetical protein
VKDRQILEEHVTERVHSNLHTPLDRHIEQQMSDGEKLLRIRKLLEREAYYAPGATMDEIRKIVGARTYSQQTGQER